MDSAVEELEGAAPADAQRAPGGHRLIGLIAGMSRSGTTWMARTLGLHPDIAAFGESSFWSRKWVEPGPDGFYGEAERPGLRETLHRKGSHTSLMADAPGCLANLTIDDWPGLVDDVLAQSPARLRPGELFHRLCDAVGAAEGKDFVVEKTPHHINAMERILAEIPDARFVLTWRDAYGFTLSYKHQGDRRDEAGRRNFEQLHHPVGVALVWRGYARSLLRARERHAERVLLVSQASIHEDPDAVVSRVQEFLGVRQVPCNQAGRNSSFEGDGSRPELAPEDVFWLNRLCGKEMERLGLERLETPFAPLRVLGSMLTLPKWALSVPGMLRGSGNRNPFRYALHWLRR